MLQLRPTFVAFSLALLAVPVTAQDGKWTQPVYKCNDHSYSHAPCGRPLNQKRVSKTYDAPPQDRARQMQRAQLPPDVRRQCGELESAIRSEEARLRAKPEPTQEELGDLAIKRVNYRDMRC